MTERGQHMLKCTVRRRRQLSASAESIAKDLQTSCGLQISTKTVLHGMSFHGRAAAPSLTSPSAMQSVRCSGVKQAANGL
ncbi:unnamed protein product [Staurois parvus]|uniref:Transposase n=1 Tax=Staurois parvus TaxID=386267 RepID=A0ABN9BNW2_9NEOB|nr:unnamed protein product [Staurois parvus]